MSIKEGKEMNYAMKNFCVGVLLAMGAIKGAHATYVGANPISNYDPDGLLAQCATGLDFLKGNMFGPLHHEYQCWTDATGKQVCRGFGRAPNSSAKSAIISRVDKVILKNGENRSHDMAICGEDDKNQCMNKCAEKEWMDVEKSNMQYGWALGSQCQGVQQSILQICASKCHANIPQSPLPPNVGDVDFPNVNLGP